MNDARGSALDWDKKDVERLSTVSDADIERAKVFWRTNAKDKAKDILDAKPVE